MIDANRSSSRSWTPPGGEQHSFPGLEPQPLTTPSVELIPPNPSVLPAQSSTSTGFKLPFNIPNMGELKNVVDRLGGIDGILSTVGKVQKFMSTMQQFAPMIKLFMKKGGSDDDSESTYVPRRRRRPRRRPSPRRSRQRRRTAVPRRRRSSARRRR